MTITEQKAFLQQYTGKAQAPAGFAQAWAETVAALQPEVQLAPVPFANPCGVYEQLTVTYQGRTVTARGGAASPAIDVPRFEPQRARLAPHDAVSGAGLWYRGAGSRTLQGRLAGQARAGGFPHAVSGCAGRGQGRVGTALGGCGLRLHIWRGHCWRPACCPGSNAARRSIPCPAIFPVWVCWGARTLTLPILRRFAAPKYCWAAA